MVLAVAFRRQEKGICGYCGQETADERKVSRRWIKLRAGLGATGNQRTVQEAD